MVRKKTQEEFINQAKEVHGSRYDYSKVYYVNDKTKLTIICKEHGEFFQRPGHHLQKRGCPKCGVIFLLKNTEEFIRQAEEVHNGIYDYSKVSYINTHVKVTIICKEHGEFSQRPYSHLQKCGCPKCGTNRASIFLKKDTEEFINQSAEIHGSKYDYSKVYYVNDNTKVIIICKEHGEFFQRPHDHLQECGCPKCAVISASISKTKDTEEFIKQAVEVHNGRYDYSKVYYVNTSVKVTIICKKHGEFSQTPNSHLQGHGCPKCQNTYKQNKWLDILKIPDDKKHREVTIWIGKKRFRVDGYDEHDVAKTVYEFNGDSWHGNPKVYKQEDINPRTKITYGQLYKRTIQKERALKRAGYKVISIWETDFDKEFG